MFEHYNIKRNMIVFQVPNYSQKTNKQTKKQPLYLTVKLLGLERFFFIFTFFQQLGLDIRAAEKARPLTSLFVSFCGHGLFMFPVSP